LGLSDRKSREFERRGQDILDAALSLFATDAWEEVTVAQIARQAEVGKGTIYKHFVSKHEIYAHLAMDFQRQIIQQLAAIDDNLPVLERFAQQMRVAWQMHLSSEQLHRVFLYCSRSGFRTALPADTLQALIDAEQQVAQLTEQLVVEGVQQGLFPDRPLPLLLFGAKAAFWGAIQLVWSGYLGDIDHQQHLKALTNFIVAGLVNPDARLADNVGTRQT
jgi:AcrR family transcriptional regulator